MAEKNEIYTQPLNASEPTTAAVDTEISKTTLESIQRVEATINNPVERAATPTVRLTSDEIMRRTMNDVIGKMRATAFDNAKAGLALLYTLGAPWGATGLFDAISAISKANEHVTNDRFGRHLSEAQSQRIAHVARMTDPYPDATARQVRDRMIVGTILPPVSWISPIEQLYHNNIDTVRTALEGTRNALSVADHGPAAVLANVARRLNLLQTPQVTAAAAVFA
jgi:hypothetical protein